MHVGSSILRGARAALAGAAAGLALGRWRRGRNAGRPPASTGAGRVGGGGGADRAGWSDEEVPEAVLLRRVRDEAAVPAGVELAMTEGAVVVFGRIARHALAPLLDRVARVEGVSAVENRLTPVDDGASVPPA